MKSCLPATIVSYDEMTFANVKQFLFYSKEIDTTGQRITTFALSFLFQETELLDPQKGNISKSSSSTTKDIAPIFVRMLHASECL
jgi:hypothetical protein